MKKALYFIIAISAVALVSCAKEIAPEKNTSFGNKKTITFSASIELNEVTKASLDGLDIKWSSSDHVFVAADNNATLQDVIVVPGTDKTQCEITINAVEGASTYYFIYTGAADPSNLSFDTTTKTFSGSALTLGASHISASSPSGTRLSMAGKTSTTSLTMIPCLAMVKIKINSNSVSELYAEDNYKSKYDIDYKTYYSGVRGIRLIQKGSSTIYSSGLYKVDLSSDIAVSYNGGGSDSDKSVSREDTQLLDQSKTYIGFIIPGGSAVTGLSISFYGFKSNSASDYNYSPIYPMELNKSMNIKPGDCYDLGTLDPVTRQKSKDHAAYDAIKPFTPVIDIDGSFTDWDPATNNLLTDNVNYKSQTGNSKFKELKVAYDEQYIYFYIKRNRNDAIWGNNQGYYYFFLDTDNNSTNGTAKDGAYYDYGFFVYPFAGSLATGTPGDEGYVAAVPGFKTSATSNLASGFSKGGGISLSFRGVCDSSDVEMEFQVLRTDLEIDKDDVISIASYGNKSADSTPYTKITGLEVVN